VSAADATRYLKYLVVAVVILGVPQFVTGYNLYLATLVLLAIMGAVALNLLTGNAGQVSLGNAAFIAMGSFGVAVGTYRTHLPFLVLVPLATIAVLSAASTASAPLAAKITRFGRFPGATSHSASASSTFPVVG